MQVNVTFSPLMANTYLGELSVKYESSEEVFVQLCGNAEELAVRLDTDALICDPTYIHLSSRKTVSIINRSDTTVHFEWKAMQVCTLVLNTRRASPLYSNNWNSFLGFGHRTLRRFGLALCRRPWMKRKSLRGSSRMNPRSQTT